MNKHVTDALSLAFGAVFLGVVVVWLVERLVDVDPPPAGWVVAGTLVVLGVLGLAATALHGRGASGEGGS